MLKRLLLAMTVAAGSVALGQEIPTPSWIKSSSNFSSRPLQISANGAVLSTEGGSVLTWSTATGKPLATISSQGPTSAVAPDGSGVYYVAMNRPSVAGCGIYFYDLASYGTRLVKELGNVRIVSLAPSTDNASLAVALYDLDANSIQVRNYRVSTGELLGSYTAAETVSGPLRVQFVDGNQRILFLGPALRLLTASGNLVANRRHVSSFQVNPAGTRAYVVQQNVGDVALDLTTPGQMPVLWSVTPSQAGDAPFAVSADGNALLNIRTTTDASGRHYAIHSMRTSDGQDLSGSIPLMPSPYGGADGPIVVNPVSGILYRPGSTGYTFERWNYDSSTGNGAFISTLNEFACWYLQVFGPKQEFFVGHGAGEPASLVFDAQTDSLLQRPKQGAPLYNPSGKAYLTAYPASGPGIALYNINDDTSPVAFIPGNFSGINWASDTRFFVIKPPQPVSGTNNDVLIFDRTVSDTTPVRTISFPGTIDDTIAGTAYSVFLSPDGTRLVWLHDQGATVWNARTGSLMGQFSFEGSLNYNYTRGGFSKNLFWYHRFVYPGHGTSRNEIEIRDLSKAGFPIVKVASYTASPPQGSDGSVAVNSDLSLVAFGTPGGMKDDGTYNCYLRLVRTADSATVQSYDNQRLGDSYYEQLAFADSGAELLIFTMDRLLYPIPTPVVLTSATVTPTSGTSATTFTLRVGINHPAPAGGVKVQLSVSGTGVTLPSTITVPAGSVAAKLTFHPSAATSSHQVTVTATYDGYSTSTTFTINP